jgi:hypothetical protein
MNHINDKIADFVFQELSLQEMKAATTHLAECSGCREQVEQFQSIHARLKTSPDLEPPRRVLFEFEKPRVSSWMWRWLAPMAASAAVSLAVVNLASPRQTPPQVIEHVVPQQTAAPAPSAQPINYQEIVNQLQAADRAWLEDELKKRDAVHAKEIQRVRGEVDNLAFYQRIVDRDTQENKRDVQLLAARTDGR